MYIHVGGTGLRGNVGTFFFVIDDFDHQNEYNLLTILHRWKACSFGFYVAIVTFAICHTVSAVFEQR